MAKMKLGDILTDIVAPVGAMGLAAYGGRRGNVAAAIGMSAVNNIAENKRRKRLGETIASLADARAEADLKKRAAQYGVEKEIERKRSVEAVGGSMPDEWVGPLGPDSRLQQYIEDNPEPVRDQVYTEMGRVALEGGDPEAAMEMMKDTEAVKARIDEASRMAANRAAEAYAGRDLQRSEMEANRVFNETKLEQQAEQARAEQAYRDASLRQSGELGRARNYLESQQLSATMDAKEQQQLGYQLQTLENNIQKNLMTLTDPSKHGMTMEEAEAYLAEDYQRRDAILARLGGATQMLDLRDFPLPQSGGTPAGKPPDGVTPAGKTYKRADGSIAGDGKIGQRADVSTKAQSGDGIDPKARLSSAIESGGEDETVGGNVKLRDSLMSDEIEQMKSEGITGGGIIDVLTEKFGKEAVDDYYKRNGVELGDILNNANESWNSGFNKFANWAAPRPAAN